MARTERFCTQRCVLQWLDEHPDKTPKDAVGDSRAPLFSLASLASEAQAASTAAANKSSKSVPRALKKLHIDMAPPGTTLQPSDDIEENETKVPSSKKSPLSQLATTTAKRSQISHQPPAIKKVKTKGRSVSPYSSSKSVKFDLEAVSEASPASAGPSQSPALPGSISIVPLNKLSEFVREQSNYSTPAKPTLDIKIPPGTYIDRVLIDYTTPLCI